MLILDNGVAVVENCSHHRFWCAGEHGLTHDPWLSGHICRHIRKGSVAIDIGAHIGTHCYGMLKAGAFVHAFEPYPASFECLCYNVRDIATKENFLAHPYGLSNEPGWARIVPSKNAGATKLVIDPLGSMPLEKLDDVIPKDADVSVIKADCEGMEVRALLGAGETITRCKPVIICEVNKGTLEEAGTSVEQLYAVIEALGYSTEILQPECNRASSQYDIAAFPI